MKASKAKLVAVVLASTMVLSGCSAVSTAVKKRNLEVQTQMSDTIWLDPVSADKKTIYVQIRNTTDKQIDISDALQHRLVAKGYRVVNDPATAHYWLQSNILKLDKMDLREANGFLTNGYGSALAGGTLGMLAVASRSSSGNSIAAGGLIGAAIGIAADALVEDVNYAMITDIQIVEKTNLKVNTTQTADVKNGSSSHTTSNTTLTENKKRYNTRIVSTANQVNLDFEEAKPVLVDGLATSISGVF
ncbi:complement resistance protein TraT [Photobacterium ganghwense]|uniref:complement resistance protein TraT n=1 Tax=Photobacterium ganghwense TaxID=320778 RepID=UPI001A8D7D5B|nr:complement resistance protein TraT [Photobacterium ganghwense]QSV16364.1 complement resistance protein TraT [Photobacterium ganghwense]